VTDAVFGVGFVVGVVHDAGRCGVGDVVVAHWVAFCKPAVAPLGLWVASAMLRHSTLAMPTLKTPESTTAISDFLARRISTDFW
jgi:hypothetical protein